MIPAQLVETPNNLLRNLLVREHTLINEHLKVLFTHPTSSTTITTLFPIKREYWKREHYTTFSGARSMPSDESEHRPEAQPSSCALNPAVVHPAVPAATWSTAAAHGGWRRCPRCWIGRPVAQRSERLLGQILQLHSQRTQTTCGKAGGAAQLPLLKGHCEVKCLGLRIQREMLCAWSCISVKLHDLQVLTVLHSSCKQAGQQPRSA